MQNCPFTGSGANVASEKISLRLSMLAGNALPGLIQASGLAGGPDFEIS